jgi:hypothetical protein
MCRYGCLRIAEDAIDSRASIQELDSSDDKSMKPAARRSLSTVNAVIWYRPQCLAIPEAGSKFSSPLLCNQLLLSMGRRSQIMPLGNNIAEFVLKMTSVRQTDLGGGQRRLEIDYTGEVSGPGAGNHYGTLTAVFNENDDPARPNHYSWGGNHAHKIGRLREHLCLGSIPRHRQGSCATASEHRAVIVDRSYASRLQQPDGGL